MAEKDAQEATQTTAASVQAMRAKIAELDGKIARITDLFVEQDIERGDYLERKRALMSEKKSVQERILLLERNAAVWLEPMRAWLQEASVLEKKTKNKTPPPKKTPPQKILRPTPPPPRAQARRRAPKSVVFFVGGQRKPLRK